MQVRPKLLTFGVGLAAAVSLMAGGFVLQIGKPSANPEAQAKNAVLVVRGFSCAEPEKTKVTGTAEGFVNGKRESVALNLMPLAEQSSYAVAKQWPSEGRWVLAFTMTNPHMGHQSAMVKVEGGTVNWAGISRLGHAPTQEDLAAALDTPLAMNRE